MPGGTPPPIPDFRGRRTELETLRTAADERGSGLIPVYGRRRVGKTELIIKFLQDRPGVFHVGKQAPAGAQIRDFLEAAARALDEPLLAQLAPRDWEAALRTVVDRWRGPDKLVLALDEFQWTVEASPDLPSTLQKLWDLDWSRRGDVLLLLSGSYVGFMEREVLGSRSPLFGRRTGQLHLQPFSYREAREFHPGWALPEAARAWFVCGGIPAYLKLFRPDRSVAWSIRHRILDADGALFREADFLLREELRDVANYHAVLMALAEGSRAAAQVARTSGVPQGSVSYYLDQLVSLGYVARRYPLDGSRPARRHVRFVLAAPLLLFWFRFVFPQLSVVRRLGADASWEALVAPSFEAWCGARFEALCREALPDLWQAEGITSGRDVGEYWSKELQVDVVGLRADGWIDLGECKWGRKVRPSALAEELERKARRFPNPTGATLARRAFARTSLPADRAEALGLRWHGLDELYGLT